MGENQMLYFKIFDKRAQRYVHRGTWKYLKKFHKINKIKK